MELDGGTPRRFAAVTAAPSPTPIVDMPQFLAEPCVDTDHVEFVALDTLALTGSPRSGGVDCAHVQRLMEAETPLPPILVHRQTMRVIDGFHRVAAAERAGAANIAAHFVDGPVESLFVVAVRANVTHGLPLSLSDRRIAAERILRTHASWSDRVIASATGLSAKTVSSIRCASGEDQHLHKRLGRDGRLRPLDASAGRLLAAELLTSRPGASLREIAAEAGVSPGTVRDVRARLNRGDNPVPNAGDRAGGRPAGGKPTRSTSANEQAADVTPVLMTLSKDPALRMNAAGRELLRWLHLHAVNTVDSHKIVEFVPDHCVGHLVELASRCAANWTLIAQDLEQRAERPMPDGVATPRVPDLDLRTG